MESSIALSPAKSGTYYITSAITPSYKVSLLLDTGSSYTILNDNMISLLNDLGLAEYRRNIVGTMADGSETEARVYLVKELMVGDCRLGDLEVVSFPSNATAVLGINALKMMSPFSIDAAKNELLARCS